MRGDPKVGVPVRVKEIADSPKMVINSVHGTDVDTTWFANGIQQKGTFNADVLEKAVDDDKKPAAKTGKKK